ncbi:MAG: membrane protein insertion efficiency factor YidD [Parcubacteria group bacterium]|nr:MAG: membrane protein insertion efficiency factor YidD [Parcubacteria group bacterium]
MKKLLSKANKVLSWPILVLIRLYQHTLSPDTGWFKIYYPHGFCPYDPHCSEYSHQAFYKYGVFRGLYKSISRLLRCHPWARGGADPLL